MDNIKCEVQLKIKNGLLFHFSTQQVLYIFSLYILPLSGLPTENSAMNPFSTSTRLDLKVTVRWPVEELNTSVTSAVPVNPLPVCNFVPLVSLVICKTIK